MTVVVKKYSELPPRYCNDRDELWKDRPSLGFDFHATNPFDFFSARYFFITRRFFCLLRLYEFFRASCFMLLLLVRRDRPAGCLRMGVTRLWVRHPRRT